MQHSPLALLLALTLPSLAYAQLQLAKPRAVEAPYSLTAADGTGLELIKLEGRSVIDGPLAFTELSLVFRNPQPRAIEGHFKVTMPDGAAISRFAMMINGRWMEGEVVEKQAARRAYEDALHRKQDPALLEQDAGNVFRARVFPIPARGEKHIKIAWTHQLTERAPKYRLPLRGLPRLRALELSTLVASAEAGAVKSSLGGTQSRYQITQVSRHDFLPDVDWEVPIAPPPAGGDGLRNENLAMARFTVGGDKSSEAIPNVVLLFDTSASRAIGYHRRLTNLRTLIGGLSSIGVQHVQVIAFDQQSQQVFSGAPKDFGEKASALLEKRAALGASDLGRALAAIEKGPGPRRVIVLGDGVATAGERDPEGLRRLAAALGSRGVLRVDAIVDTTARDPKILHAVVTGLPKAGKVIEGKAPLAEQLARLGNQTLAPVAISVPGAQWWWPQQVEGLQPGDTVIVHADLGAAIPLSIDLQGGASGRIEPKQITWAERPLLERSWIAARINRLLDQEIRGDEDLRAALRHQIIALSTRHRVLSPYTALVVLESEAEYRRFGIDRRALADILVVGPTGIELARRSQAAVAATPRPPPPPAKLAQATRAGSAADVPVAEAVASSEDRSGGVTDMTEKEEARAEEEAPDPEPAVAAAAPAAVQAAPAEEAPPPPPMVTKSKKRRPRARRPARRLGRRAPRMEIAGGADPFPGRTARTQIARQPRRPMSQGRREFKEISRRGNQALTGRSAKIARALRKGRRKAALKTAWAWRHEDPTDLLALVALGRALDAAGDQANAARAFGSILDLYPSRADMRRMAGNWLEALGRAGLELAADTYQVAMEHRPDHPSVYHQLAMVLVRLGRYEQALDVALQGVHARRVRNRFAAVERILQEDAQMIGAAWAAAHPGERTAIAAKLSAQGLGIDTQPTIRFVLTWETDANDVDFHIFDREYDHAYYSRRRLASGGELYADITTGYGPECFTVHAPKSYPYRLKAHYYSRGPMGYGMGKLQVVRHDGKGGLGFDERPFVIMSDGAYVDLGVVKKGTAKARKPGVAHR